jgi:deazaflavin-dependent oxidoreductase (nitroreductase family)
MAAPLLGLRGRPGRIVLAVFGLMPIAYRLHLGRLIGHSFLLLEHRGRTTGQPRTTALKVVDWDPGTGELVVLSVYGRDAGWLRNITANPASAVQVAGHRFRPTQRFLAEADAVQVVTAFQRHHPRQLRLFSALFGWGELRTEPEKRAFVAARPLVAFAAAS